MYQVTRDNFLYGGLHSQHLDQDMFLHDRAQHTLGDPLATGLTEVSYPSSSMIFLLRARAWDVFLQASEFSDKLVTIRRTHRTMIKLF